MIAERISGERYHALGESGELPEKTELLYGVVYPKPKKTPLHCYLISRMVELLQRSELPGRFSTSR